MHLASLALHDFRSYSDITLSFVPGLNVLFGDNAQGKTNLLEAIYFLATGRSHRTVRDQELIREGRSSLQARAAVMRQTGELSLEVSLGHDSRKQLKLNGIPERKISRLIGRLATVFFSPDDLNLLKGAPAGRRRFLDVELSQISETYLHYLMTYNRVLAQRNTLLKGDEVDASLLDVYDQQLLSAGTQLVARRAAAIERLAPLAADYHRMFAEGKETLRLAYQSQGAEAGQTPDAQEVTERLWSQMQQRRREEIRRQMTLVGPHRDDIGFWISERDARLYGSQGQQRTAVLALKLAELEFMAAELGENPILLLDDVASELDPNRRHYLLNAVQEGVQTFITCTDLNDLTVRTWPSEHRLFRVRLGSVEVDQRGLA